MAYTLRPYQERAQKEILDWFYANPEGNPIVNACVGSGKSLLIADLCKTVIERWPNQRIIMLVSSRELVRQNYEKLLSVWPHAPVGIHSAGLRRKDIFNQIIFASIGSVAKKAMQVGRFDLGLVDECHNINVKKTGMYRQFIHDMQQINPHFRVIGYTGTPFRGNGVWLHKGPDPLFSDICTNITIGELLDQGYLSPLVVEGTDTKIDASGVQIVNGDYNLKQLAEVADRPELVKAIVDEIIQKGADRHSWVIYAVDVKHATHFRDELVARGVSCALVHGKTPVRERDKALSGFQAKRIRCMVNCMVLTVGWDNPATDLIALARNSRSPVLYTQIAGRGLRIDPDKKDCLWLDFTDTTATLGPVDRITGKNPAKPRENNGSPFKICPECEEPNPAGVRFCKKCDAEFPEGAPVLNDSASLAQVLSSAPQKPIGVTKIFYFTHTKRGGEQKSLRVEYLCGMQVYKEWVPFESDSMYARTKADIWWRNRSPEPTPRTVEDAIHLIKTSPFREPTSINTRKVGKYDAITNYHF